MKYLLGTNNTMKMKNIFIKLIVCLGLIINGLNGFSQDGIPEKPQPPKMVNDFCNILSPTEKIALEEKLVRFNDSTSNQIIVVIVSDLGGRDETDFADRLGEKWGVGQKGKNNGVVVLVKPTGGQGERKTHISVGYGLEGSIPDATAFRIVEEEMIPNFKKKDYYKGIDAAVNTLISLSKGEFTADQYNKRKTVKGGLFKVLFPVIVILIIFIIMGISKGKGGVSPGKSVPFWLLFSLMGSGSRSSGSWGGFSGGSGGGSSFGGFGGGSFGGGGAGGSW